MNCIAGVSNEWELHSALRESCAVRRPTPHIARHTRWPGHTSSPAVSCQPLRLRCAARPQLPTLIATLRPVVLSSASCTKPNVPEFKSLICAGGRSSSRGRLRDRGRLRERPSRGLAVAAPPLPGPYLLILWVAVQRLWLSCCRQAACCHGALQGEAGKRTSKWSVPGWPPPTPPPPQHPAGCAGSAPNPAQWLPHNPGVPGSELQAGSAAPQPAKGGVVCAGAWVQRLRRQRPQAGQQRAAGRQAPHSAWSSARARRGAAAGPGHAAWVS